MNAKYETLLRHLPLTEAVVNCAMGRLRVPVAGITYPPAWYGYPPALLPIWSEGFIYVGLWKHWFTERPMSFVKVYVRAGHSTIEIARTPEQFLCYATVTAIVAHDCIRPETERFVQDANITNLAEIDSTTMNTGDDPSGFTAIRQFQIDSPLASVADISQYDGWFPRADFNASIPWWQYCCSLELSDNVRAAWPVTIHVPTWVATTPTKQMFRDFVLAGDYSSAWLTLNSTGWSLPDARAAISMLATAAGDNGFSMLADAWLTASTGETGGY